MGPTGYSRIHFLFKFGSANLVGVFSAPENILTWYLNCVRNSSFSFSCIMTHSKTYRLLLYGL